VTTKTLGVPRKTLASQIDRLDTLLDGLADAIPDAVADAVRQAVREAVQTAVTDLLAHPEIANKIAAQAGPAASRSWLGRAWDGCCQAVRGAWEKATDLVRAVRDLVGNTIQSAVMATTQCVAGIAGRARAAVRRCWLPLLLTLTVVGTGAALVRFPSPLAVVLLAVVAVPALVAVSLWFRPALLLVLLELLAG
jgi:hypothetical protein